MGAAHEAAAVKNAGVPITLADGSELLVRFTFATLAKMEDRYASLGQWAIQFTKAQQGVGQLFRLTAEAIWLTNTATFGEDEEGLTKVVDALDSTLIPEYSAAVSLAFSQAFPQGEAEQDAEGEATGPSTGEAGGTAQ